MTSLCLLHKASTVDHYAHRRVSVKAGFLPSTDFSFLRHLIFFLNHELNWFSSRPLYQVKHSRDGESTIGTGELRKGVPAPRREPSCPVLSAPLPPAPFPPPGAPSHLQFWAGHFLPSTPMLQVGDGATCGPAHRAFRPWGGGQGSPWLRLPALFLQVFAAQEVVPARRPLPRPAHLSQADLGTSLLGTGKVRVSAGAERVFWEFCSWERYGKHHSRRAGSFLGGRKG